jgi:hypothetical protein
MQKATKWFITATSSLVLGTIAILGVTAGANASVADKPAPVSSFSSTADAPEAGDKVDAAVDAPEAGDKVDAAVDAPEAGDKADTQTSNSQTDSADFKG